MYRGVSIPRKNLDYLEHGSLALATIESTSGRIGDTHILPRFSLRQAIVMLSCPI